MRELSPLSVREFKRYKERSEPIWLAYDSLADIHPLYADFFHKRSSAVWDCASYLEFKVYENGDRHINKVYFCKDRFCNLCKEIEYRSNYFKLSECISRLYDSGTLCDDVVNRLKLTDNKILPRSSKFVFGTLTIPNCSGPALSDTIKKISHAWDMLLKRLYRLRSDSGNPLFYGFFCVLEITYKYRWSSYPSGDRVRVLEFHPHLHFLGHTSEYYNFKYIYLVDDNGKRYRKYINQLPQNELCALWSDCCLKCGLLSGDTFKLVCDIRLAGKKKNNLKYEKFGISKEIVKGDKYAQDLSIFSDKSDQVSKSEISNYISKGICKLYFLKESPEPLYFLSLALKGVRVFRPSGSFKDMWRKLKLSDLDAANAFDTNKINPTLSYIIEKWYYDYKKKGYKNNFDDTFI